MYVQVLMFGFNSLFDAMKLRQASWLKVETDSRLVEYMHKQELDATAPPHDHCQM